MKLFTSVNDPEIVGMLAAGQVGVIRTDTLYGVIARAQDEAAVNKVYALKERTEHKSPIVLVHSKAQLFDQLSPEAEVFLDSVWPGPVSVIIPSTDAPLWIRRQNDSVAYRQPDDEWLQWLLAQTGPLIAPSANPEGETPAMTIQAAQDYFGDNVDFYVDGGEVMNPEPSKLIKINDDGSTERLR